MREVRDAMIAAYVGALRKHHFGSPARQLCILLEHEPEANGARSTQTEVNRAERPRGVLTERAVQPSVAEVTFGVKPWRSSGADRGNRAAALVSVV